jgi:hypothetical protein
MGKEDNRVLQWLLYQYAWWHLKKKLRRNRPKLIAAAVIGLVLVGGAVAGRSPSE